VSPIRPFCSRSRGRLPAAAEIRWDSLSSGRIHDHVAARACWSRYRSTIIPAGTPRRTARHSRSSGDGLGLMIVKPDCSGPCTIDLTFDGGAEYKAARVASWVAALAALLWLAIGIPGWKRPRPVTATYEVCWAIPGIGGRVLAGHVERVRRQQPKKRIVFPEGGDCAAFVAAAERLGARGDWSSRSWSAKRPSRAFRAASNSSTRRPRRIPRSTPRSIPSGGAGGASPRLRRSGRARRPTLLRPAHGGCRRRRWHRWGASTTSAHTVRARAPIDRPRSGHPHRFRLLSLSHCRTGLMGTAACCSWPIARSWSTPPPPQLADIAIATAASAEALPRDPSPWWPASRFRPKAARGTRR